MDSSIGSSVFTGCFAVDEIDRIENWPGLYSILCQYNGKRHLIDVGESDNVRSAVENNGRKDRWHQKCPGNLVVMVCYTSDMQQSERARVEREIRDRYDGPKLDSS